MSIVCLGGYLVRGITTEDGHHRVTVIGYFLHGKQDVTFALTMMSAYSGGLPSELECYIVLSQDLGFLGFVRRNAVEKLSIVMKCMLPTLVKNRLSDLQLLFVVEEGV